MVPLLIVGFFAPCPGKIYLLLPEIERKSSGTWTVCFAKGTMWGERWPFMRALGTFQRLPGKSISDHSAEINGVVHRNVRDISFIASRLSGSPR
jgi:hypothetical protein